MTLLFAILDTLLRGVAVVAVYYGGRFLYREAKAGFPSFTDPNHRYAECQVHAYNTLSTYGLCQDLEPDVRYFHEECAKEYEAEARQTDRYFEVWLRQGETNTERHCQHCE
jgi:hypothetical protein